MTYEEMYPCRAQIIRTKDDDLIFLLQHSGKIHAERFVTASVFTQLLLIYKHHGSLICRADVQQHPPPVEAFRKFHHFSVSKPRALREVMSNA